jgi:hypothetical protein
MRGGESCWASLLLWSGRIWRDWPGDCEW